MTRDWRARAACLDEDPELFFPIGHTGPSLLQIEEAKAVCQACPVRATCLDWALEAGEDHGVWGGLDEDERREVARRRAHLRVVPTTVTPGETKTCGRCRQILPLARFTVDRSTRDGLHRRCRQCRYEAEQALRETRAATA